MNTIAAPILLSLLLPAEDKPAPKTPFDEAARKELKALEGDWALQRLEAEGKKHEPGPDERMVLTIKGAKWSFPATGEQGEVIALGTSSSPRLIDLKSTRRGREALVREGIYKLDGDTLVIALYQGKEKKRPTSFDTPTESGTVLFVLERARR
jgi:uncharacterized protein (TIGR03067 family)